LTFGIVNVAAQHGLEAITAVSNTTPLTIELQNADTSLVTTGNVEVGGNVITSKDLMVTGNVTTNSELIVAGNVFYTNLMSVSVKSNVVTEYTGPHDRPLRKYPEVTFPTQTNGDIGDTTVTYKGYTLTSSTTYPYTNHNLTNVFDGLTGDDGSTGWSSNYGNYTLATGEAISTNRNGLGDYIQLELPNAIKIQHIKIFSHGTSGWSNGPRDITLYGSNSGNEADWTSIKVATDLPLDGHALNATVHVNSMTFYRYFRLEVNKIWVDSSPSSDPYGRIAEWELYGHEEGSGSLDTTLKTVYNVPATTETQLEVYYDGQDYGPSVPTSITDKTGNGNNTTTVGSGIGFDSTYKAFTFDGTSNGKIVGTHGLGTGTGIQYSMSLWFKADVLSGNHRLATFGTQGTQYQSSTLLIYQNDIHLDHWLSEIKTTSDILVPNVWYHLVAIHTGPGTEDVSQNALYLNGVKLEGVTTGGSAANGTFNLQGTGLTIGADSAGTHPFDGSIANFRLYSKALNADQVKELYDYQKDYFLGSKSQVTLYKGHLGIGVTEPSGQLELAGDERLQEYPPRAMTDYDTHIEGHGVFKVYASSWLDNASFKSWGAFDKNIDGIGWHDTGAPYTNGSYTGTSGGRSSSLAGINGEWIVLKLPYAINLKSAATAPRTGYTMRAPGAGVILGSNDGNTWDQLHSFSGLTATDNTLTYINNITAPGYYTTFALLVTELAGAPSSTNTNSLNISEIKFFGIPGPTTLDKGSLSLTQILDVPHVSRYDVDTQTPRPDKLILNYDTTVNSRPVDISGKGNHGEFYGNAKYSKEERAFEFDGSSDTVYIDHNGYGVGVKGFPTGDAKYTMSCWIKANEGQINNVAAVFYFGSSWTTAELAGIYHSAGGKINMDVGARNTATTNQVIFPGRWHHVAIVKRGTGAISTDHSYGSIYIDGEEVTNLTLSGGGNPSQSLNTIDNVSIGSNFNGSAGSFTEAFDGWIAKPQAWNVPLENSEIRKIYNLGHTGRSMMISDTAIGIGKAPEAQLDVRGTGRFQGIGVNTDNLIGALQVHQGPNITFGGTSDTIRDVVPGFVISSDSAKWAMFINGNDDLILTSHDSLSGTYTGVTGYILEGAWDQRMNDFTGQHRCFLRGIPREQIKDKVGLIVSSDKNKYTMISGDIVTGQNAIDISESIPDVSISQKAHDKACFGVISDVEDPEKREDLYGVFGTPFPKEKGDDRVYINSVGEGAIWVANTNGSLEAGDYITTSNVAGYGQKQDSAGLMNYTVAKITMDCDFNPETQPIQIIKRDETGENILDEHGQIQWEDHPTETEKAYKLRYLTVDGTQTDEANAVHTAAFVGCTYHCG
jgi:hypothetical protein